jgi:hypothetical protein
MTTNVHLGNVTIKILELVKKNRTLRLKSPKVGLKITLLHVISDEIILNVLKHINHPD